MQGVIGRESMYLDFLLDKMFFHFFICTNFWVPNKTCQTAKGVPETKSLAAESFDGSIRTDMAFKSYIVTFLAEKMSKYSEKL